ncbi:hypothetical protein E2C01_050300 [Portunus trituberculatus]|uniref:Uncharacterized protein n=1 Tax=Portunus trituberculatus TaxID=210409 RepID=A0A5B7GG48_PORTR|nr:hypothetical protein [Portunus trituberculatus]
MKEEEEEEEDNPRIVPLHPLTLLSIPPSSCNNALIDSGRRSGRGRTVYICGGETRAVGVGRSDGSGSPVVVVVVASASWLH